MIIKNNLTKIQWESSRGSGRRLNHCLCIRGIPIVTRVVTFIMLVVFKPIYSNSKGIKRTVC